MRLTGLLLAILTAVPGCVHWGPPLRPEQLNAITLPKLTPEQAERVRDLPIVMCLDEIKITSATDGRATGGTAIILAPDRLLMSAHQMRRANDQVFVGGEWREFEVEARGDYVHRDHPLTKQARARGSANDWMIIRIDPPVAAPPPPLAIRPQRVVAEGEIVYVAGFWGGHPSGNFTQTEERPLPPVSIARFHVLPAQVPEYASRVLWMRMTDVELPMDGHGFSGGPVMAWDEQSREFVLVGVLVYGEWAREEMTCFAARVPPAAYD